jgi:hypothetical protein
MARATVDVFMGWRWSILNGYLPMWSWTHKHFEWLPSDALLQAWIDKGEVG